MMKAWLYGIFVQFQMDIRSRSLFITCYLVPLLFFLMMGSVFTSIMPESKDTLIASMTIMGVSMGAFIGLPPALVEIYGSPIQKTYLANDIPVYYGLLTLFMSSFLHLLVMSSLILCLAPLFFDATIPTHLGIYYLHLILLIMTSLSVGAILGLFVKTQAKLTMLSQLVFLPSLILSGIMFPSSLLPSLLENLGKLFPATWGYRMLIDNKIGPYYLFILLVIFLFSLLICWGCLKKKRCYFLFQNDIITRGDDDEIR